MECGLHDGLLTSYCVFRVNPGVACVLMTFLVAITKHLKDGAKEGNVCFRLVSGDTVHHCWEGKQSGSVAAGEYSCCFSHNSDTRRQRAR